jgi:coenzyme F420 hydrogenase subunit beta
MMRNYRSVRQIVNWRLCLGCGACAYICPERKIRLMDFVSEGIRPVVESEQCGSCKACLEVCPAFENQKRVNDFVPGTIPELIDSVGPVLELWEGHATDQDIRFRGASGGVLTALSLYCLEKEEMYGVLHIGMDSKDPTRNSTQISRTRSELLSNAGSRYAPASVCDGLGLVESAAGKCVVIGQPSEITAVRKACLIRPQLAGKIGVTLSFFCAGTPARAGLLDLLRRQNIDSKQVASLRYRGGGWPGLFSVTVKGSSTPAAELTYGESWGFMQAYRPLSTHLCPDGTGEDADISCGDPWYRDISGEEPGMSMVVVRTELGRQLIRQAVADGYLWLTRSEPSKLLKSQKNLIAKRGAVGGRIATMRLMGLPTPRLLGFNLLRNWLRLSLREKLRSTLGTVRRVLARGYYRQLRLSIAQGLEQPVPAPKENL